MVHSKLHSSSNSIRQVRLRLVLTPSSKYRDPRLVPVIAKPQSPKEGQEVTLTIERGPKQVFLCEWYKGTSPDTDKIFQSYTRGQKFQQNQQRGRVSVQEDCSLVLRELTTSDASSYTVRIEAPLKDESMQFDSRGTCRYPLRDRSISRCGLSPSSLPSCTFSQWGVFSWLVLMPGLG
uniref:Immunoglobulin V-set domain-containing protein n=1 Tax=Varanus komodoensis TaxID=61221 RepID=A0A8D2JC78_VARKO